MLKMHLIDCLFSNYLENHLVVLIVVELGTFIYKLNRNKCLQ
jgi:hypothetical protein